MVNYEATQRLNLVFHTLADPTRREILYLIANKPYTVSELAKPFDMSLAAISKHLNVLEKAGLLYRNKEGRICYCYLDFRPLLEAAQAINQLQAFWEQQFDSLEKFLEHTNEGITPLSNKDK
ncbi:MAG: metalloregulator ArsR/SmtB family transcription factor [Alphaproteobacteria bacterium]|nr:metalloregulator ArsR/SmtB family transcription factor [Alphaproteobacteria bacterium]